MALVQATPSIATARPDYDADALVEALAELPQLDAGGLSRRWRSLIGGSIPLDLGRPLILRMLAYKLQAQRLGDLDKASQRGLAAIYKSPNGMDGGSPDQAPRRSGDGSTKHLDAKPDKPLVQPQLARPGTVLALEHNGIMHRVSVLDQGVSWNGKIYESLSKVAFAITGTRWNGPRFFGLRDGAQKKLKAPATDAIIGRGRATSSRASVKRTAS